MNSPANCNCADVLSQAYRAFYDVMPLLHSVDFDHDGKKKYDLCKMIKSIDEVMDSIAHAYIKLQIDQD